jgi:hypothetical protein
LASFSSRGPLRDFSNPPLGPLAQKPEVAAPGVEINAAFSKDSDNNLLNLFDFSFQQGNRFVRIPGLDRREPRLLDDFDGKHPQQRFILHNKDDGQRFVGWCAHD